MIVRMPIIMRMVVRIRFGVTSADPFNMVVMAFLWQTVVVFEADNLFPVFTHQAIHIVVTAHDAAYAFFEAVDDAIVVVEVTRFNKLNIRKFRCDFISNRINATDQMRGLKK